MTKTGKVALVRFVKDDMKYVGVTLPRIDNNSLSWIRFHFGRAFEGRKRQIRFWARLETEIRGLFGVYSQAFSIYFTVGEEGSREGNCLFGRTVHAFCRDLERGPRDS